MSLNRTAKGIVLVPTLLLGGAFLAAATWLDGPAAAMALDEVRLSNTARATFESADLR